jgi:hypothetical protein
VVSSIGNYFGDKKNVLSCDDGRQTSEKMILNDVRKGESLRQERIEAMMNNEEAVN